MLKNKSWNLVIGNGSLLHVVYIYIYYMRLPLAIALMLNEIATSAFPTGLTKASRKCRETISHSSVQERKTALFTADIGIIHFRWQMHYSVMAGEYYHTTALKSTRPIPWSIILQNWEWICGGTIICWYLSVYTYTISFIYNACRIINVGQRSGDKCDMWNGHRN